MTDEVIYIFGATVFLGGLVAIAWMHWFTRDARRIRREQHQHPAE